jgi:secondary thiamine-phosphate synthase enzyme
MTETVKIQAPKDSSLVEITQQVTEIVENSGVSSGIVTVMTPHTDTGILCTSFYDPKGHEDIIDDFTRIFPARDNFHYGGAVREGAAHSKASVAGMSMDFILENGKLELGGSQGIFFAEYCKSQPRTYYVTVFGV